MDITSLQHPPEKLLSWYRWAWFIHHDQVYIVGAKIQLLCFCSSFITGHEAIDQLKQSKLFTLQHGDIIKFQPSGVDDASDVNFPDLELKPHSPSSVERFRNWMSKGFQSFEKRIIKIFCTARTPPVCSNCQKSLGYRPTNYRKDEVYICEK